MTLLHTAYVSGHQLTAGSLGPGSVVGLSGLNQINYRINSVISDDSIISGTNVKSYISTGSYANIRGTNVVGTNMVYTVGSITSAQITTGSIATARITTAIVNTATITTGSITNSNIGSVTNQVRLASTIIAIGSLTDSKLTTANIILGSISPNGSMFITLENRTSDPAGPTGRIWIRTDI